MVREAQLVQLEKSIRIVQVSDTHISRKRSYFMDNWELFLGEMRASPPDLIVHSGDLSFDGADDEDDIAFARTEQERLPAAWLAIPGNHDIGESPLAIRLAQPIDDERIARWRRHFGTHWWCKDTGAWRIIGIDTALLGSDRPEARAQWEFLERSLAARDGRPVLLVQHMPPFLTEAEDPAFTALAVPFAVRGRLLDTCLAGGVCVIACGHVHIYQQRSYRGMDIVWAPATSFFNIVQQQEQGRGVPRAGYVEWTLRGTHISHRLVEPPLMITHDVGAWNAAHGSTTKMPPRPLAQGA